MTDTMINAAIRARVLASTLRHRAAERLTREDGQVSIEWVGILALVGAIIAVILTFEIDQTVRTEVQSAINDIFGGGGGGGGGEGGGGGGGGGGGAR